MTVSVSAFFIDMLARVTFTWLCFHFEMHSRRPSSSLPSTLKTVKMFHKFVGGINDLKMSFIFHLCVQLATFCEDLCNFVNVQTLKCFKI